MIATSLAQAMRATIPALRSMGRRGYGVVYFMYCAESGKGYIGQTVEAIPYDRYFRHLKEARSGADGLLYRAIRAHGVDAFTFEILATCDNKKSLNDTETFFIRMFGTLAPDGYNLQEGGSPGKKSEELKEKLRLIHSTPETRQRHREAVRRRWDNPDARKQVREMWDEKNILLAPERERIKRERLEEAARLRPAKIAARNASIKKAHANPLVKEKVGAGTRGSKWANNGVESKRLKPGEVLPEGWSYGRGKTYAR